LPFPCLILFSRISRRGPPVPSNRGSALNRFQTELVSFFMKFDPIRRDDAHFCSSSLLCPPPFFGNERESPTFFLPVHLSIFLTAGGGRPLIASPLPLIDATAPAVLKLICLKFLCTGRPCIYVFSPVILSFFRAPLLVFVNAPPPFPRLVLALYSPCPPPFFQRAPSF